MRSSRVKEDAEFDGLIAIRERAMPAFVNPSDVRGRRYTEVVACILTVILHTTYISGTASHPRHLMVPGRADQREYPCRPLIGQLHDHCSFSCPDARTQGSVQCSRVRSRQSIATFGCEDWAATATLLVSQRNDRVGPVIIHADERAKLLP